MQIINDYNINNIFETTLSSQSHKKGDDNGGLPFDTVSISDAALQAYASSKAAHRSGEESEADNNPSQQFKKHFNSYRGNGIFAEDNSVTNDNEAYDMEKTQQTESEKTGKTISELERKIKDLTEKLGSVMSSSMPEHEKDMMANQIHKELEELQSQLNAYKQAEKLS